MRRHGGCGVNGLRVIGADPGPVPGIALLDFVDGKLHRVEAVQCTHGLAPLIVRTLIHSAGPPPTIKVVMQVEGWAMGARSGKSSTPAAGRETRNLIGVLRELAEREDVELHERVAGLVKPWASNARLAVTGLLSDTEGMRHARDGARHALYVAVKDCGIPDPLSSRGREAWKR